MNRITIPLIAALILVAPVAAMAETDPPRPNILWITSEDNSSHWLGCYGNEQAQTPRIDTLANEGVLFAHAYSNAPVCAVARATILIGAYSPTMGTQHMRSRHAIPEKFRPYVEYLRATGYHCTNNSKTDYNFKGDDNSYWDESSGDAHYKDRPEGKPFFAIFNITVSHESWLFTTAAKGPIEPERLKPSEIDLPPYLPDLPEIRKDYARYHDRVTDMDTEVGRILDELEEAGLADETIVFYYSDHGGVLPRGKRYLEETGVKVPLVVRVPEKFRHLSPFKPGDRVTEPVAFVDLAPTLLSLAGIDTPAQMQGRAFLGSKRLEPAADEMEFLYADRFDELYGMRRGLTDGKWKYIRNFNPDFPTAPYSFYQFGQPGWIGYREAYQAGKLEGIHKALWEAPGTSEQLYDLAADPWEINNLAADPAHAERLAALRERLKTTMQDVKDTGLVPEPLFQDLSGDLTLADYVQSEFDLDRITDLAFTVTEIDTKKLPRLKEAIASSDPTERYWGLVGLRMLGEKAVAEADSIIPLLEDKHAGIRTTAARHRDTGLAVGETTIADALSENGYATALFGKWHLGYAPEFNPVHQGFDEFIGFVSGNVDFHSHFDQEGHKDWWHGDNLTPEEGYVTHLITRHGLRFIEENKDQPFFLYLPHLSPHYPYQGPNDEPIRSVDGVRTLAAPGMDIPRAYREMMIELDKGVGEIMTALDRHGLAERTLVIFCSDNGANEHGSNGPFRAQKGSIYEGGHRVPMIARWPGVIPAGKTSDTTVLGMDIFPTLLDAAGIEAPNNLDGTSILPVLRAEADLPERTVFWSVRNATAARRGPWKLVIEGKDGTGDGSLYHLGDDPAERNPVENPEVRKQLREQLDAWLESWADVKQRS